MGFFGFGFFTMMDSELEEIDRSFHNMSLDDKYVLPGCHLKLLAPKKKPYRSPDQGQFSKSFSFDDRRRSRSFTSETSNALSTASISTGFSRARAGSYSFHGRTKSGIIVTPKRYVVTSTPKVNYCTLHLAESFSKATRKTPHNNTPGCEARKIDDCFGPTSPSYGKPQNLIHTEKAPSWFKKVASSQQKLKHIDIGPELNLNETKRAPRSPVEQQLDTLTDLLQDALTTDSVHVVTSYDNSTDSLSVSPKETHWPHERKKMRSASDSGTESLISENSGSSSIGPKKKPPPPHRSSSKEAVKTSPQRQPESPEHKQASGAESPMRSIIRPRIWVDTSNRARDNSIKVASAYLKKDVKQLRIQLEELRNQHENSSHNFHFMITNTRKRIADAIHALMPVRDLQTNTDIQRQKLREEEDNYQRRSDSAEKTMRRLENETEMLREAAVIYKSIAEQSEIDEIHSSIESLNKSIASLKFDFQALERNARGIMAEEKHSLFEEDRFFKEEPLRLEQLIKRCHHVVGALLTLQKMASVQRNTIERSRTVNITPTMKNSMKETDTIKRAGTYKRSAAITQISRKAKVEHVGRTTTADYNQNTINQGNIKTKVRFNDSADNISYHQ